MFISFMGFTKTEQMSLCVRYSLVCYSKLRTYTISVS